ncbi:MaoC family dehydratase [Sedimentitalea sp. JM2-8]|uniref:MaoC family dehydratase n=1 Tax=Sedimentitalea xiamensis TaxID=3050037 RepID=A0ABT7FEH4_9RHOB|nr:MaoC family dehydratase [Sedimentitalea xiamensis]MDK3073519.1 MaoC family dehydratase [Sedimentitalea xiamensis]
MTQTTTEPGLIPFESIPIGQVRSFGAYEVTKEEIIEFASKYDAQFFHLDEEAAKDSLFGGLCASGWHTCAMTMAMLVEDMKSRGKSLGSPGIDQLRWKHPVFPGDILSVRMEVIDKIEPKSRSDIGFVVSKTTVSTQTGTEVMEFISKGIFPKTGGAS